MNRSHYLRTGFTGTVVWIEIVERNGQTIRFETVKRIEMESQTPLDAHERTSVTNSQIVWFETVKRIEMESQTPLDAHEQTLVTHCAQTKRQDGRLLWQGFPETMIICTLVAPQVRKVKTG